MALGPTLGRWACSQAAQSLLASLPQWECLESYRTGRCSKDRINLPQHHDTPGRHHDTKVGNSNDHDRCNLPFQPALHIP